MAKLRTLHTLRSLTVGTPFTINPVTNREGVIINAQAYLPGANPLKDDYAVEVRVTLPGKPHLNTTLMLHPDVQVRV